MRHLRRHERQDGKVVAVIGDGAMTGGVAFEAIGQAGGLGTPIVVVLNDNGMSIAPERRRALALLQPGPPEPEAVARARGRRGRADAAARRDRRGVRAPRPQLKESIKAFWAPGLWWEELDWAYMGVIDGHDVRALREALREALAAERPSSCTSRRSRARASRPPRTAASRAWRSGTPPSPSRFSNGSPTRAARAGGRRAHRASTPPPQYTQVFGEALVRECRRDERVVGHHRRDELGHGPEHPAGGAARALLRRRHRRAAGDPVRRRPGARGRQAGRGDLLDVPAAGLRPDRPRRMPAAAERRVRDGPRRPGRRRRAHPPRRVRHRLPALPAEHRADGSARRGDAGAHAAHGARLRRRADRAALPARGGHRAWRCRPSREAIPIGTGEILREAGADGGRAGARGADRLRQRCRQGARGGRAAAPTTRSP